MELDTIDAAILRCLQEDARASLRTVAKKVGVSVPTVSARFANLEQLGIVRGYRAVLDPDRLGETTMTLVVKTRLQATEAVTGKIAERDWARRVLTGRPGWVFVDATVTRREAVDDVLRDVSALPDVTDVHEYLGLKTVKDEPRVIVVDRLPANLACFESKGPILGEPLRVRLDGRTHYFCCHSCERLYLEKYRRIRAAARRKA